MGKRIRYEPPLDTGIADAVNILAAAGIETYESCEGGKGHSYPEPTIRFYGEPYEGFRALAVAMAEKLPVKSLRRIWEVQGGEPVGSDWEMVFWNDEERPKSQWWS